MNYLITSKSVTVFDANHTPYVAEASHPNFSKITEKLRGGSFLGVDFNLFDITNSLSQEFSKLKISRDGVSYAGNKVHNVVCDRIVENFVAGYPIKSLVNFLEKVLENPYKEVVNNLYTYMEKYKLAINEAGNILGIKAINANWTSKWNNKFVYKKGIVTDGPVALLDHSSGGGCGRGLYFGFHDYVFSYGDNNSLVIAVEVNPAHILGIPSDHDYQKMRAHTVNVLGGIGTVAELKEKFKMSNIASKVEEFKPYVEHETAAPANKVSKFPTRDGYGRFVREEDNTSNITISNTGQVHKRDAKGRFVK